MSTFPETLARRIGAAPPLPNDRPFLPSTPLDWALHHAATGVHVFPAENFVGNPLIEDWYDRRLRSQSKSFRGGRNGPPRTSQRFPTEQTFCNRDHGRGWRGQPGGA